MQKSMRKLLSLLLTLAMLLSMPLTALAEEVVVSEEPLPIVEEVAASEATESAELPTVEVPVTEEVVIEEVLVEEVPAVEETPVVEATVSAPVAVLAAVEEEAELYSTFSAQVGTYDAATETYTYGETVYTTFAEALAAAELAAAADTAADVVISPAGEDTITAGATVSGNVRVMVTADTTLTAAAVVTFDGNSAERTGSGAFFMVDGAKLTLENIAIANMTRGANSGGAINVQSGAEVVMTNGSLSGNTAGSGGALYSSGKFALTNVDVSGNEAGGNGGAVFMGSNTTGTINGGVYANNTSNGASGGGVVYMAAGSSLTVSNAEFKNNEAADEGGGGAINTRGTLTATNVKFEANESAKSGGAVYIYKSGAKIVASGCTFTDNVATNSGGAVYNDSIPEGEAAFTQQEYTNCTFTNNEATTGSGGAICSSWSKVKSMTIANGCTFTGNTAPASTRASGVACGNIEWVDSKIVAPYTALSSGMGDIRLATSCSITASGTADLGTINTGNKLTIEAGPDEATEITVAENSADITVTVDMSESGSYDYTVTVNDTVQELDSGAFVLAASNAKSVIKVTAQPKAADDIKVAQVGDDTYSTLEAAVEAANALGSNTNITLINDITYTQPTTITMAGNGRIYVKGGDQFTISGPLTLQGDDETSRYVIYVTGVGSKLTLDGVTIKDFNNTKSDSYGVARVDKGGEIEVKNATLQDNSAYRGVFYITDDATGVTSFTATNCTFEGNVSPTYGGALGLYGAPTVKLEDCSFIENEATGNYGGAIGTYDGSSVGATVIITDCTFDGNVAGGSGGALFLKSSTNTISGETKFTNNTTGKSGAAIYWCGTSSGTVEGVTFTGNKAANYCSSVYALADATITLKGCSITGNHASGANGYGLYLCGKSTLENVIVKDNTSDGLPYRQVAFYNNADVTIKGANNELIYTTVSSANTKSINLAEGFGGTMTISFSDQSLHQKYLTETELPLFTGDGFAAAFAAGMLTIVNDAYTLLDTGYLKLNGIATVDGVYYPTITDAIDAAALTGGTVVLADTDVDITEEIFVYEATLDLNGQTVISVEPVIYNGAQIIDSTDGEGKLVCAKGDLIIPTNNKYLPVWVDEPDTDPGDGSAVIPGVDHYCFTSLETINTKGAAADGTYTYISRPELNEDIAAMLAADGAEAHGLKFRVLLKWMENVNYSAEQPFVYTDEHVKTVYGDNMAFYAYVTNYANYVDKSLEISVQVVSDTGVTFTVPATAIQE